MRLGAINDALARVGLVLVIAVPKRGPSAGAIEMWIERTRTFNERVRRQREQHETRKTKVPDALTFAATAVAWTEGLDSVGRTRLEPPLELRVDGLNEERFAELRRLTERGEAFVAVKGDARELLATSNVIMSDVVRDRQLDALFRIKGWRREDGT